MKKIYHKSIELSGINKYYNGIYHNVFIILDKKEIYINNNLFRFREIIKLQEFVKEVTL